MNQESGIDELVKLYLQSKGYSRALEALKEDTGMSNRSESSSALMEGITTNGESSNGRPSSITEKNIEKLLLNAAESFCFLGIKKSDISIYQQEYDQLYSWTNQSLDTVKYYLQAINFVLFVYCYIGMIRFGYEANANKFWDLYHSSFMIYFQHEMEQLSLLQSKQQLEDTDFLQNNLFVNCAINRKFIVHVNTFTFNLFSYFLSHNELILLASIINDKVIFQKMVNDSVDDKNDLDCNLLVQLEKYTPGQNEQPALTINPLFTSKITLGVPGTGELLNQLKEKSLIFRDVTIPDLKKESIYKIWIDKLIRPKYTLQKIIDQEKEQTHPKKKKVKKLENVTASSSSPPGPSPSAPSLVGGNNGQSSSSNVVEENIDETWTSLVMNPPTEETEEVSKGNPLEPSIIFATISNCDEGLICMNLNQSVTQAATGYQDSIVRVWRLDENVDENREKKKVPFFGRNLKNYNYALNEVLPKPKEAFSADYVRHQQQLLEKSQVASSSSSLDAPRRQRYPMIELKGHSGPIYSVDQNSSNRLILSSSADESIRLWDTSILQCVAKYTCNSISWDAKFNPILDYYFASANQDTTVTIYSTDRILPLRMLTGHISDVNCLTWHGNNTFLASGSDDRTIRLWDIRSAQCHRLLKGSNSPITSIQICPVGNLLAAGNELGKIYLFDLRSSRILSVLQGHDSTVNSVCFNPENNTLVSGGQDCSVRIWDLLPAFETSFISTPAYQINPPSFPSKDSSSPDPHLHPSTSNLSGLNGLGQIQSSASSLLTIGGVGGGFNNQSHNFENYITKVIKPKHSFFTKASPVYHVGYTKENLVYGGGPCSFLSAASSREKYLFPTTNQSSNGIKNGKAFINSGGVTNPLSEQEAINMLGLSAPTSSNN